MKLVSVNIGLPREVSWRGETVTTGIFNNRSRSASRYASSIWTAIVKQIFAFTAANTRPSIVTHLCQEYLHKRLAQIPTAGIGT